MTSRILKINKLIKEEVGKLLLEEVDFPEGVFVTISRVETSRDLAQSQVFLNIFPLGSSTLVLKILASHIFRLQQILNKKLNMRKIPKIEFEEDKAEEHTARIDQLLEKV